MYMYTYIKENTSTFTHSSFLYIIIFVVVIGGKVMVFVTTKGILDLIKIHYAFKTHTNEIFLSYYLHLPE